MAYTSDERSNWARAVAQLRAPMIPVDVETLVTIGTTLTVAAAERVYRSLREEPRDAQGAIVDWLAIRARILQERAQRG